MANVSIRMDDTTKTQFDAFCNDVGLSISAAFNLFAKKVIREHRIPFEITNEEPFYSSENMAVLREAIARDKAGLSKEHSVEEL